MSDDLQRGTTGGKDFARATLLVCGALIAIWLLRGTILILLAVFLSIVFGVALSSGVDRLAARRVPRALGATLIMLVFFGCLTGLGLWLAPTIRAQSGELRQKLPVALERVQGWLDQKQTGLDNLLVESPSADSTGVAADTSAAVTAPGRRARAVRSRIDQETGHVSRFLFPVLHSTVVVLGGILFIVFLTLYFGIDPEMYRRGIVAVFPIESQPKVAVVLDRVATVLRKWLVTQLIVMAVMGAASTAALLLLHVKAAVALGVLAGVVSFIPTVGGIVGAAPAVAMGFLDSPEKAVIVAIVYLLIHFAGSHVLVPVLMRGGIDLPPALTLIAQAMLTALFGFLGLMVAVPLLAVVLVIARATYVEPRDEGVRAAFREGSGTPR